MWVNWSPWHDHHNSQHQLNNFLSSLTRISIIFLSYTLFLSYSFFFIVKIKKQTLDSMFTVCCLLTFYYHSLSPAFKNNKMSRVSFTFISFISLLFYFSTIFKGKKAVIVKSITMRKEKVRTVWGNHLYLSCRVLAESRYAIERNEICMGSALQTFLI